MAASPKVIEAEARLLYEAGRVCQFYTWETLPECLRDVWRMRVEVLGERADLS